MNKLFKDPENKKKIFIITTSGILISAFVMLMMQFDSVVAVLQRLFSVMSSFFWGILFALILRPLSVRIENIFSKKWPLKTRRLISSLIVTILLIVAFVVFIVVITPALVDSVSSLSNAVKDFSSNPSAWINMLKDTLHLSDDIVNMIYNYSNEIVKAFWQAIQNFVPSLVSATVATFSSLVKFIIGFIVCIYVLVDRQEIAYSLRKFALLVLDEKQYARGKRIMYLSLEKFSGFFSGKILDSLIVGLICFVAMLFINSQYAALIAIVVGVTNIIPFFGPFIGAIPCALILLIVNPLDSLIFIIMVVILQQIDGNIIGPRILGNSVGLSSLWIMFAIIVGGSYFGFFGMLLGVPVFSIIYYIIKDIVDEKIENKETK